MLIQLTLFASFMGASFGVVREHCVDVENSSAETGIDIDNKWSYILWPPGPLANLDPAGGCVRNSPLREALNAAGLWELPSPEAQVRDHVQGQVSSGR